MATPRIDTEAAKAAQSPSLMGPLSTRTTGDFTRHVSITSQQEWSSQPPSQHLHPPQAPRSSLPLLARAE